VRLEIMHLDKRSASIVSRCRNFSTAALAISTISQIVRMM
jgi:hypothetical protein